MSVPAIIVRHCAYMRRRVLEDLRKGQSLDEVRDFWMEWAACSGLWPHEAEDEIDWALGAYLDTAIAPP